MPKGEWQPPESGNAPAEVRHILKVAYAAYRDKHGGENPRTKAAGAKRAWGAVKRAGWKKNPKTGRWVRKAKAKSMAEVISSLWHKEFGGEGSGNFGHEGRPNEVGGSAPGDGGKWKSVDEEIARLEKKMVETQREIHKTAKTGEFHPLNSELKRVTRDYESMKRYREYGVTDTAVLQWCSQAHGVMMVQKEVTEAIKEKRQSDWLDAVRTGKDGDVVYRGYGVDPDDPRHPKNWVVDGEIDHVPASFSKNRAVADRFADAIPHGQDGVVIIARSSDGTIHGLDISKHPKSYLAEAEVIVGGRFKVRAKQKPAFFGAPWIVEVEQVGVF